MKKIVFDSSALIALFRQEAGYEIVRDLLVKVANDESEGFISAVTVGEISYLIRRKSSMKNADAAIEAVKQMPIQIIEPDLKMCIDAAALKVKYSLSYADAFAVTLTMTKKAIIITGDHEFDLVDEANFKIKYLQ